MGSLPFIAGVVPTAIASGFYEDCGKYGRQEKGQLSSCVKKKLRLLLLCH